MHSRARKMVWNGVFYNYKCEFFNCVSWKMYAKFLSKHISVAFVLQEEYFRIFLYIFVQGSVLFFDFF